MVDRANQRVQKFKDVVYSTTAYSYDALGNLLQIKDNALNTTTIAYDWLSRKTGMTDPEAMRDAVGNPVKPVQYRPDTKGGNWRYIGKNAIVVLNKAGEVITTWAKNVAGRRFNWN